MNENLQGQGSLERLGIPLETVPVEGILTPGAAKGLRFRVSRPEGYAYADVESFIFDILIPSLDWYAQKLHERDLGIHKLGEELDKAEIDIINLRAQVENSQYNEVFGASLQETELDSEVAGYLERIQELTHENEVLRAGGTVAPAGDLYSREEVEGFINDAVNAARAEEKARAISTLAAARQAAPAAAGTYTQADLDKAVREALSQQAPAPLDGFYTYEEVQAYIQEAVAEARAEEQKLATMNGYTAADVQAAVDTAVAAAENKIRTEITPTDTSHLYTEEEVQSAVNDAVKQAEADFAALNPELDPEVSMLDNMNDEGDLRYRAESEALRVAYTELVAYTEEMEAYIAKLEGRDPSTAPRQSSEPAPRDLPPIEAQDL